MSVESVGHYSRNGVWSEPAAYDLAGVDALGKEYGVSLLTTAGAAKALLGGLDDGEMARMAGLIRTVAAGNPGIFLHGLGIKRGGAAAAAFGARVGGQGETEAASARKTYESDTMRVGLAVQTGRDWLTALGATVAGDILRAQPVAQSPAAWGEMPDPDAVGERLADAGVKVGQALALPLREAHAEAVRIHDSGGVRCLVRLVEARMNMARRRGTEPDPATRQWPDAGTVMAARDEIVMLWKWDRAMRSHLGRWPNGGCTPGGLPELDLSVLRACGIGANGQAIDKAWSVAAKPGFLPRLAGSLAGSLARGAAALEGAARSAQMPRDATRPQPRQ